MATKTQTIFKKAFLTREDRAILLDDLKEELVNQGEQDPDTGWNDATAEVYAVSLEDLPNPEFKKTILLDLPYLEGWD